VTQGERDILLRREQLFWLMVMWAGWGFFHGHTLSGAVIDPLILAFGFLMVCIDEPMT